MWTNESSGRPLQYGLLLFPQFEVLDAAGPIEMLNVLALQLGTRDIKLSVIAKSLEPVSPGTGTSEASAIEQFNGQQKYLPTHTFETAPVLDVLIVPGGRGTVNMDEDEVETLLSFIRKTYHGSDGKPPLQYIFSICTGAALLARAGVLDGKRATMNKSAWKRDTPKGRKTHWVAKARWVQSGNAWTCSGVSAGMDGMVAFIAAMYGDEAAEKICRITEYPRMKDSGNDPFADENGCQDVPPAE